MRIGIDYTSAVRQSAGIGRYTRGLLRAVAALDRQNRYVLFSAGRDPANVAWPDNFRIRSLPVTDRHLAIIWQRLRLPLPVEVVTGPLDLYHSPDFVLPPVLRARTVLTIHDLSFYHYPECSSPPLLRYLMTAVPRSVRRADMVVADSESTRQDVIELLGVPQDRVAVVYAGVEPHFTTEPAKDEADVPGRYGIRTPFILAVGTLQPRKNYARLIRALHRLHEGYGLPHQLVIVGGKGWLYEEIEHTIAELGLQEDRVLLAGFVRDEDLPALYRAADVFAYPSLYEGFGIPLLESMACGTPVVTTNVSSMPEVAGEAALLVPPDDIDALADALARTIQDESLRDDLRQKGLRRVREFTWESAAQRLLGIYQHVA
ncbi:MAG TPA: glycosyltransferase family 4 protein [Chloroflexi bacterium]|jgi:glycosyltransferase involved in cell wall biosynthesis|nr:glycosyltransferase family 4 protein [Chloroflexota bacterium]